MVIYPHFHSPLLRLKLMSRSFSSRHSYTAGAAAPSAHLPTGITNSVMSSEASRNRGFSVTGEWARLPCDISFAVPTGAHCGRKAGLCTDITLN